jgi:hypothetical protein
MLISDLAEEDRKACEICMHHKDGCCDGCGSEFTDGEKQYHSPKGHVHEALVNGVSGVRAVTKLFCIDCYRKDFKRVYPYAELPDLPDRGMDPNFHAAQARTRKASSLLATLVSSRNDAAALKDLLDSIRRDAAIVQTIMRSLNKALEVPEEPVADPAEIEANHWKLMKEKQATGFANRQ